MPGNTTFRVLDHDADLRLEIYGSSEQEMFENAAGALFSLIVNPASVTPSEKRQITVGGNGELLINFLNELIYLWDTHRFITARASVSFTAQGLTAILEGEGFNPERHDILVEMKAVTYHDFPIREDSGTYTATIVIDV